MASLRARSEDEVADLVETVLVQPAARRTVEDAFEAAEARYALGVRPRDARSWLLGLARELALARAREHPELAVRPDEGFGLLPYERTLLHLYRRCGIGADALAEALSDDRERLAVMLARLDRRFLDAVAVRVLVVEGGSHCAAYNAIVAANHDRLEAGAYARGHAHSCPDCRAVIAARAEVTDTLGRPTPVAVRPTPVFDHRPPARRRRRPVRSLAVAAVVAAILATAAFAVRPGGGPQEPAQPGPADVSPPQPVTGLTVTNGKSVLAKPGLTVTWKAGIDDVGVTGYEVYVDGTLAGQTSDTSFVVATVGCGRTASIGVDAFDSAGNRSSITSVQAFTPAC